MTPFGRFIRNLRLEKGLLLKDMADDLGVTTAYLSALEHGKKGQPSKSLAARVIDLYDLNDEQANDLFKSIEDSKTNLSISPKATPMAFETANAFARKLDSLSEKQLKIIRDIVDE